MRKIINFIKYDLLKKPLELKKTNDILMTKKPRLTVVMIHGIASSSKTFRNALKYLAGTLSLKSVRFITYDLLGSGKSYESDKLNYDYKDQLTALNNSIKKLKLETPLVLVGHSMGTFIVTRYADTYKKAVKKLILVSPPVYTEKDLENPDFAKAIDVFKESVSRYDKSVLKKKSFNGSMEKIVLDPKNYQVLKNLKTKAVLIYGEMDQFIASFNIPKLLKENSKYLKAIRTTGKHGASRDKYAKMPELLEEVLNETV